MTGDVFDIVYLMVGQATATGYAGDWEAGVRLADEALDLAERSRSPIAVAWAAYAAGEVRLETEPDDALACLRRAVDASRSLGERMVWGVARLSEVTLGSRLRRFDDVHAYGELIEHWQRMGAWTQQWTTLCNLVVLLVDRGEQRWAARLLGAARVSSTASPSYGAEGERLERVVASLRRQLGDDLDAEIARGAELGDDRAVALALQAVRRLDVGVRPGVRIC